MIFLWIILGILILLLLLLIWLLVAPVILWVDTEKEDYHLKMPLIFKADLVFADNALIIRFLFLEFIKYHYQPSFGGRERDKTPGKKSRKSFRMKNIPFSPVSAMKTANDIFRAFDVKRIEIDFDTDDEMLNALIYPVCLRMNNNRYRVMVNFDSYYRLFLNIQWRMVSFVGLIIRHGWRQYVKPAFVFK